MSNTQVSLFLKYGFLFPCFLFVCNFQLSAQSDTTKLRIVITHDGNEYLGTIVSQTDEALQLNTKNLGILNIKSGDIRKIMDAEKAQIKGKEIWLEHPQSSRYFISTNSYGLKKGEAYYQNVWIWFNQFAYGVSDHFSIGLGVVPLFLLSGTSTPVWITPKFSIPVSGGNFALGAGALIGTVLGEDDASFGFLYGTSTFGNRDNNLTVGLGYGYAGEDFAQRPTFTLSGMVRTGKRGYILTENYLFSSDNESGGIVSLGGRTVWTRVSLDYGGFIPVGDDVEFGIGPWLGIMIRLD